MHPAILICLPSPVTPAGLYVTGLSQSHISLDVSDCKRYLFTGVWGAASAGSSQAAAGMEVARGRLDSLPVTSMRSSPSARWQVLPPDWAVLSQWVHIANVKSAHRKTLGSPLKISKSELWSSSLRCPHTTFMTPEKVNSFF